MNCDGVKRSLVGEDLEYRTKGLWFTILPFLIVFYSVEDVRCREFLLK